MSTTFGELQTRIATVLLDPDGKTFTVTLLPELTYAALIEVGRVSPADYSEDLTPVAYQMEYLLGTSLFDTGNIDIEPMQVEVWDATTSPEKFITKVNPAGEERFAYGDNGWTFRSGYLRLPTRTVSGLVGYESSYVVRVYGYSPHPLPTDSADVVAVSQRQEQAVVKFARVEGLEMLLSNRDLFTQWQTRSGNSDVSPAGLMNQLSMARADWRQYSRNIARLRSPVG